MQEMSLYEYAVIRWVPRVEREEFLNIGVLVYCPSLQFLELRFYMNEAKMSVFCPDTDFELLRKQLAAFEQICSGASTGGMIARQPLHYRFRWLAANRSTIIQFSKIHPGFCTDPGQTLTHLLLQLVS